MEQNKPCVSILVPVYNVEDYLRDCLDSLIGQTLQDIEIVCVNDGSTDGSMNILNEYAAKDDRIVIVNKQNGGLPSARNAGIEVARGDYVGFVDADDSVELDMYEKMYNAALTDASEMVVCGAKCFPQEEEAPIWMKEALSPANKIYTESTIQTFYSEKGATPFIWRYLVSRSLIEKHNLRLDESIILGEDLAFQFKLYSHVKKISFLSDKLYHYRWKRPHSIMEDLNYKDFSLRILKHLRLIESMWECKEMDQTTTDRSRLSFYEWVAGFIYWDIISLSLYKRIEVAIALKNTLNKIHFFDLYEACSEQTKNYIRYYESVERLHATKPRLSIVLVMNGCKEYVSAFLDSLARQSCKDYEVIAYTNGANGDECKALWERFFEDQRLCIRAGEWKPLFSQYNEAIGVCGGDYIMFSNGFDLIKTEDYLEKAISVLDSNNSVSLVGQTTLGCEGINDIRLCEKSHFRDFVYRVSAIRENKLHFEDYSFLTGCLFFTNYCLVGNKVFGINNCLLHNEGLRRRDIFAEEAKLLLRGMKKMLLVARREDLPLLGRRITDMLNSENYVRLLTDSTFGFFMDKSSIKNPKEDFHREVLESLLECNALSFLQKNEPAVLRALSSFIFKRHRFLENI